MAMDFVDIALETTPPGNNGSWWGSALGRNSWLNAFNNRGPGDRVHLGCDPQFLTDYHTFKRTFNLTAGGDASSHLRFMLGNIGSRIGPEFSQDGFWFVGPRPDYFRRQQPDGPNLFEILGNYLIIEGLRARGYNRVLNFQNAQNNLNLLNVIMENATFAARFNGPVDNAEIDGVIGKNTTAALLIFDEDVTNTNIRNVSALNANCEDGEAIALRFLGDNNQNILIENVNIGGQHDHWIGSEPKNPYEDEDYSAYTQGEIIAIEGGSNITIRRAIGWDCTDRLIDCKGQCIIEHCGGNVTKRGITMWAPDSHASYCAINGARTFGNTSPSAYLMLGDGSSLNYCSAVMLTRSANATVIVGRGGEYHINGGEYIQPADKAFVQMGYSGSGSSTVHLNNVNVNGKNYTMTLNFNSGGAGWVPT